MARILMAGFGNDDAATVLANLREKGVTRLYDVRHGSDMNNPKSSSVVKLTAAAEGTDIKYTYLGGTLGGKVELNSSVNFGTFDYKTIVTMDGFQAAVADIKTTAENEVVCIASAELNPMKSHRGRVLAHEFLKDGHIVVHVTRSGKMISHDQAQLDDSDGQMSLFD